MPDGTETETETEQPTPPVSGDAATEQPEQPAPEVEMEPEPAPSTPDQGAALADLAAQVADLAAQVTALTGERDAAIGQAVAARAVSDAAQVEAQALRDESAILRERLLSYELGAALTMAGLPPGASNLVRSLYAAALRDGCYTDVGVWLATSMADPNHPAAALSLMRAQPAQVLDPRNSAAPMNGAVNPSHLKPFPVTSTR